MPNAVPGGMNRPLDELFRLRGQVAIVTGAAKGIGLAVAARLAEAGAAVVLSDVDDAGLATAAQDLRKRDFRVETVHADASIPEDAKRVVAHAMSTFGRLDCLVNNAGIFPFAAALDVTPELWERVVRTNLSGAFFFAQAAAREMRSAGRGTIVNIASIDALHPTGALAHYDASKGGMLMLTRSLALELGPLGIRVNTVCPGSIDTPGARAATGVAAPSASQADLSKAFLARVPLKRTGTPDDIATAALFLATEASSYVTGATLVVDGGYLLS